jgi:DNA-binding CsgD family transcriptional regulator
MPEETEPTLTEREEEVIELVAKGVSTKAIAERLWIAVATVRNHIQSILGKLGVSNRIAAVHAWQTRRTDYAGRVLAYCRRHNFKLTDLQVSLIRAAFAAERVSCSGGQHVFPPHPEGTPAKCLCGALRVET